MATDFKVDNIYTVKLFYAVDGFSERALNVLHYKCVASSGTPTTVTAGLAAISDGMFLEWGLKWQTFASSSVKMLNCSTTCVFPLPRSVQVYSTNVTPRTGSVVSESLPLQDAVTILKKTDVGNRWGTGRMFVTGIPELNAQNGVITPGGETNIVDLVAMQTATVTVTSGAWSCSLAPVLISGPEDNPARITPITLSRLSDNVIKTQRRRRPGKGS